MLNIIMKKYVVLKNGEMFVDNCLFNVYQQNIQIQGGNIFGLLTFSAIKTHSSTKPVLIFVSSRRQTRLTAIDLIGFLAGEDNPKQWLHMPDAEVRFLHKHIFYIIFHFSYCFKFIQTIVINRKSKSLILINMSLSP